MDESIASPDTHALRSSTPPLHTNSLMRTNLSPALKQALDQAALKYNFKQFDGNGDGWIDMITFIHSGYGGEWPGNDPYGTANTYRVWTHHANMTSTLTYVCCFSLPPPRSPPLPPSLPPYPLLLICLTLSPSLLPFGAPSLPPFCLLLALVL